MPETPKQTRKPAWIRSKVPVNENYKLVRRELKARGLCTVCEEARCPNLGECWENRTATIMILGDTCTRACKFCNVKSGNPGGALDPGEIKNTSEMVGIMKLRHVVITSVDRDDLEDRGAGHFARVVEEIRKNHPEVKVEVLVPDFCGTPRHMHVLARSNPFVIAQNIEVVKRLTDIARDRRAGYEQTLSVLAFYKKNYPHIVTKSSLMVGLGETTEEVIETMRDLRKSEVDILTIGQYLQPAKWNLEVVRYYSLAEFDEFKRAALDFGFKFVASGPLVRSSYRAADSLAFTEK